MHQRSSKSSAKPASGPDCSVPATGWDGTKYKSCRRLVAASAIAPLTDPTSMISAPGIACVFNNAHSSVIAPTGVASTINCVSLTATAKSGATSSTAPIVLARSEISPLRSKAVSVLTSPALRNARARDEPIRPGPMIAARAMVGSGIGDMAFQQI